MAELEDECESLRERARAAEASVDALNTELEEASLACRAHRRAEAAGAGEESE